MGFTTIRKRGMRFAVGLSAGASCVGVDGALVRIKGSGPKLHFKLIESRHYPYPPALRVRLLTSRKDARELGLLNFELGSHMAEAAQDLINVSLREENPVDFVALQGYTLAHIPPRGSETLVGGMSIGETAVIAEHTGLPVISDFRVSDLAAGGQGAPLNSYADWILFGRKDRNVACLHLGGFISMSVVTPDHGQVLAFDTGPGNIAISGAMAFLTGGNREQDEEGEVAGTGTIIDEFLEYLLDHPFFGRVPPKSTSRAEFGPEVYLRDALTARKGDHPTNDLMATVTAAVAYSVVRAYNRFVRPRYEVQRLILTGGGVRNRTLVRHLRTGLPETVIRTSDQYGLPHDAYDSVAAAILGNDAILGHATNSPLCTGARHPVILGKFTPGSIREEEAAPEQE